MADTVRAVLGRAAAALSETSDSARLDAELLMAEALGVSRETMLLMRLDDPVPAGFGRNRATAEIFATAFDRHVGGSRVEYIGSPEGQVIVALHRGLDPFAATTVTRLHWR